MDIREFLKEAEIQELLKDNDLDAVYDIADSCRSQGILTEDLTDFLLESNIDPLDYVTQIYSYMFKEHTFPPDFDIPEGITHIGRYAFENSDVNNITLPHTLISIAANAFRNCVNLESVYIPGSVVKIAANAFFGCHNVLLLVARDSYAHRYAKEMNINYDIV